MFKRLSSELTLIYAALFGVVLLLIAGAVWVAVEANSRQAVRAEMASSSAVFDRIWKLRADQLQQTAEVLARDFGFREAVATGDDETMISALDNIQSRFGFDTAMIIRPDGSAASLDDKLTGSVDPTLLSAVTTNPDASGVLTLGDTTYQAVSAPIRAPTLMGWVVFGRRLGAEQLSELEQLSAIPLSAHLYLRREGQSWVALEDKPGRAIGITADELAGRATETGGDLLINLPERNSIGGVKTLQVFADGASAALLLEYSLSMNQAHYRDMLATIAAIGAIGLVALVLGSWFVSRRVTGPISGLRAAADQLTRGEVAEVAVTGRNEIAELAANFNVMSSEIAAREQRILHLARHDQETGLPNLRALQEKLAALRGGIPAGNIFGAIISINRFDQIRGAIGHGLFSRLVAEVATRASRSGDSLHVGRATTGTIAVVFTAESRQAAEATIRATAQAVSSPVTLDGDRIDVMVTAGLACDEEDAKAHLELLERAEVAVEQARAQRTITAWFNPAAYGDPATTLSLMSSMLQGLSSGELYLAHQPKLDLRRDCVNSAEALLRWRHPQRGMIRPDAFIGMAEETGHIRPLTDWVIDRAIADQRIFQKAGHDVTISVNVSGRLIANEQFAERALRQVRRSGARLCFEITETAVIDNPRLALDVMNELKQAGVGISIDDYGSGLSSLSYLRAIPAEELKIDKVFVENLANGNSDAFLVKSTIDLAHSLGMKLTAEGVETADVLAILRAMGADMIQGYFIAKPLVVNDFLAFMRSPDAKAASAI